MDALLPANLAVGAGIAIVFYYSFEYYEHPTQLRVEPVHFDWTALVSFYGPSSQSAWSLLRWLVGWLTDTQLQRNRAQSNPIQYAPLPPGTAVYSFEGIGLILPIQNEMQAPELFPRVLAACMLTILLLFLAIGEVPTLAFGRITNGSMTAVLHDYCNGWGVTAVSPTSVYK